MNRFSKDGKTNLLVMVIVLFLAKDLACLIVATSAAEYVGCVKQTYSSIPFFSDTHLP